MAKAGSTKQTNGGSGKSFPPGFSRVGPTTNANWFVLAEGNAAYGILHGRWGMSGTEPKRYFYQVELKDVRPFGRDMTKVKVGTGDDGVEEVANVGDVINVGESFKLKQLVDKVIPEIVAGAVYEVWVEAVKKIKTKTPGRTMWDIELRSKMISKPTSEVRPIEDEDVNEEGDEGEDLPI